MKITLDGTLPNIRPGLSAKAEITVADRQEALAVPLGSVTVREWPLEDSDIRSYTGKRDRKQKEALAEFDFGVKDSGRDTTDSSAADVKREETEGVFVLVDDFVKFVPVEIGIAGEEDFEVLSGLTEGQTVVTGPFRILRQLKDGAQVEQLGLKGKRGRRGSGDETED